MLRVELGDVTAPAQDAPEFALTDGGEIIADLYELDAPRRFAWCANEVLVSPHPLTIEIFDASRRRCQSIAIDDAGAVSFGLGDGPLFGLGQGGRQFDRRGGEFPLVNGQGEGAVSVDMNAPGARAPVAAFDLAGEGARITVPWLVSTDGWAIYFRRPVGAIHLSGTVGRLIPSSPDPAMLLDAVLVVSRTPAEIMRYYAEITGYPHLPPLWSLGYLQSHRTLDSPAEVLAEAREFRRRDLPCDGMIYLGTGFCPEGWNVGHGSFAFNPRIFPDPDGMIRDLHAEGMRVVLHVVDPPVDLHGSVHDTGDLQPGSAARYWEQHRAALRLGVDGWWPDVGDSLAPAARLARIRMYWEGAIMDQPRARPFALHRNAYAGVQRHGWVWSGDINSTWRTLAMQIPVGLNCGLTGIPYWGTDIGGFVTTPELTGELFVRWFQYAAFCPSFRGHGRTWKLRLPWGWNTGSYGPEEYDYRRVALPDPSELHNPDVEPICKRYLELRYQLLPYTYAAVRETAQTGLPVMRALWLHYPDDPAAVRCGDEYLWGRDILVAPVVEKGASSRTLYLPPGEWYDYWTGERLSGGAQLTRPVDLATLPLYVRAGAIIATGPIRQNTDEFSDEPLRLNVYPGQNGVAMLYEDDGISFDYRDGDWRGFALTWDDRKRTLRVALAEGSRALGTPRPFVVMECVTGRVQAITFTGEPIEISL